MTPGERIVLGSRGKMTRAELWGRVAIGVVCLLFLAAVYAYWRWFPEGGPR